jgi:hypothetical protein
MPSAWFGRAKSLNIINFKVSRFSILFKIWVASGDYLGY